jgi:hypothetical protein
MGAKNNPQESVPLACINEFISKCKHSQNLSTIPATFGTLHFLLQLHYQAISSFTTPELWVLFQA